MPIDILPAAYKVLGELGEDLAIMHQDVRRECFEQLKTQLKLLPGQKETAEGKTVFAFRCSTTI